MSSLVGACGDRKTTPGITGWYRARVHIDPDACYLGEHELGLDRRETDWMLSVGGAGCLRER
ncbi:MAG: hypothetical protein AYK19_07160 [Theionarchaea archaeon DG-70-1]|nr:MAG: hypothetical protein AYK19_07160 [Theionarchaea archaeon DG-70-1]